MQSDIVKVLRWKKMQPEIQTQKKYDPQSYRKKNAIWNSNVKKIRSEIQVVKKYDPKLKRKKNTIYNPNAKKIRPVAQT